MLSSTKSAQIHGSQKNDYELTAQTSNKQYFKLHAFISHASVEYVFGSHIIKTNNIYVLKYQTITNYCIQALFQNIGQNYQTYFGLF